MSRLTRRDAVRSGVAIGTAGLAGCLGVLSSGSGDDGPDLPSPALGADDPEDAVVVAAWEDFRCPHCATFSTEVLPRVREKLLGPQVRFEHHDFPIPLDRWSWRVAMAARSVQERAGVDAFWTFTETALERQRQMDSMSAVRDVAAAAGADPDTVGDDVTVERHRPVVAADRSAGDDMGVDGTPAVFVDGQRVRATYQAIERAVERRL